MIYFYPPKLNNMVSKKLLSPLLITFLITTLSSAAWGQIKTVSIGVNGLTCSACCRTVEMSIRKLSFVKDVKMNLENTDGEIFFNDNAEVDVERIAKAVTDAGFSVRYLTADFTFNPTTIGEGYCYNSGKYNLQFVNTAQKEVKGTTRLKFVGQLFQPKGEYNKVKSLLINSCTDKKEKVFFVTL